MKKLYFAAIIALLTQTALTKNNHYPLLGRLPEENLVRKNCENLNPAFLGFSKDHVQKACDSIENRLAIVRENQGYATQGFVFSSLFWWKRVPGRTANEIIATTRENQFHIQTIIGTPLVFENSELELNAKQELETLAKKLCDENLVLSK